MVTGFSAANAAETARVTPSEIGVAASVALVRGIAVQSAEQAHAVTSFLLVQPANLSVAAQSAIFSSVHQIAPTPRTYRGDRTRE